MITAFDIYLISVIGNLNCTVNFLLGFSFVAVLFCGVAYAIKHDFDDDVTMIGRWFKRCFISFLVLIILSVITPSTKTIITMYALPTVLQNDKVQQLPDVLLDYIIDEFTVKEEK